MKDIISTLDDDLYSSAMVMDAVLGSISNLSICAGYRSYVTFIRKLSASEPLDFFIVVLCEL